MNETNAQIEVNWEDLIEGSQSGIVTEHIEQGRMRDCRECDGGGEVEIQLAPDDFETRKCIECNGSGVVEPDPDDIHVHVEDMEPEGTSCDFSDPARICPGDDIKVRPFQEYDVYFSLPRSAKGDKTDGWIIAFSAKQENCLVGERLGFPEFLNIIAVDTTSDDAVDTWHIGTFDKDGRDFGRLACLLTSDGGAGQPDDVVGFFLMSFMYTITICPDDVCPSP